MSMTPSGYERYSTLSPEQKGIFGTLQKNLEGQLGGEGLDKMQAPYLRQFQEKTIPGLAEQFSGAGAGGQSSSAFQQALGASGSDLQERLAALGMGQQQNALSQLMQLLGISTEGLVPKEKPWWQEALVGLSGGVGKGLGTGLTGGFGAGKEGAGSLMSWLASLGQKPMEQGTFSSIQPDSYGQTFKKG